MGSVRAHLVLALNPAFLSGVFECRDQRAGCNLARLSRLCLAAALGALGLFAASPTTIASVDRPTGKAHHFDDSDRRNPLDGSERPKLNPIGEYDRRSNPAHGSGVAARSVHAAKSGAAAADVAAPGFRSFSSFKRAMGPAGPDTQWHHIVEQTPGNVARFGPEAVHSTGNLVPLDTIVHRRISGYYSSIQPFTGGQRVRQWLSNQPFEAQQHFGRRIMDRFGP